LARRPHAHHRKGRGVGRERIQTVRRGDCRACRARARNAGHDGSGSIDPSSPSRREAGGAVAASSSPAALRSVARNRPSAVTAAALHQPVVPTRAVLDQEDLEHGGIGLEGVLTLPRMAAPGRIARDEPNATVGRPGRDSALRRTGRLPPNARARARSIRSKPGSAARIWHPSLWLHGLSDPFFLRSNMHLISEIFCARRTPNRRSFSRSPRTGPRSAPP
jgi:hypothetical protein